MGATPLFFRCPVWRRETSGTRQPPRTDGREWHRITLAGRSRPNPSRNVGPRTLHVAREYQVLLWPPGLEHPPLPG